MNVRGRSTSPLALLAGSVLLTAACVTTGRPTESAPGVRSREAAAGPTKQACSVELPALDARLTRYYRERIRIRQKLTAAGFERTAAEAIGDGTGAPGLALEAARSADALEQLLEGRPAAHPGLINDIDWIAANWFDPVLMRWTAGQIRTLTSMTTDSFRDLNAETTTLRTMLPEMATARRRREELKACERKMVRTDEAIADPVAPAVSIAATSSPITCGPETTRVRCKEAVTVEARSATDILRPLDSSSLISDELRVLGPDSSAWIAFARAVAGVGTGPETVYVDGLPTISSVPAATIGRITVNGDPFTSEYSNVGTVRIDIDLGPPERRWHAGLSSPSFGAGGGSPLGPTGAPLSRSTSLSIGGPVPRLPLTFDVNAFRYLNERRPLFVAPGADALAMYDDLRTTSNSSSFMLSAAFVTGRVMARATFSDSRMQTDHAGIGGTNGPTTGQGIDSRDRSLQASWRVADGGRIHRGGFSFRQDTLDAVADSPAPLTMITGQLVTGGDEVAANTRHSETWTIKHVVETSAGTWKAGIEGASQMVGDERVPNPQGRLQFSGVDAATATWIVSRGRSAARMRATSTALFAEQLAVNTPRVTLRSGLRFDWQHGAGVMVSPRVVATARVAAFQVSGGAGLFVQAWSPDLFVIAAERDGTQGTTFVVHDVPAGAVEGIDTVSGEELRSVIQPGFDRRRDLVVRAGLQRRIGPLQTGIEHTWTRGGSLPGAVRDRDAGGLVDRISSDRTLRRHQTQLRASVHRGATVIVASYQHAWSFDDSDGPVVTAARQGDVRGEWGRSIGAVRHALGVTALVRLPQQIRGALTLEARSGMPYTLLTGLDVERLGAFTDRGGRPRNSGTLPSFRKASVSASRTIHIQSIPWLVFDVGLRADNLTNRRNVTSVGRAVGTPMFGIPLDATAGRSVRLWASLAR